MCSAAICSNLHLEGKIFTTAVIASQSSSAASPAACAWPKLSLTHPRRRLPLPSAHTPHSAALLLCCSAALLCCSALLCCTPLHSTALCCTRLGTVGPTPDTLQCRAVLSPSRDRCHLPRKPSRARFALSLRHPLHLETLAPNSEGSTYRHNRLARIKRNKALNAGAPQSVQTPPQ